MSDDATSVPVSTSVVEASAPGRLQFESDHVDWQVRLRRELAARLQKLDRTGYLYARLSSSDWTGDVENLLFYNVGLFAFSPLGIADLEFERSRTLPDGVVTAEGATHHWFYSSAPPKCLWRKRESVIKFASLPNLQRGLMLDCAGYWAVFRRALLRGEATIGVPFAPGELIGVEIRLHGAWKSQVIHLVKPAVDGLLSSLGPHSESPEGASFALAVRTNLPEAELSALLRDPPSILLPSAKPVLHRRAGGIQFAPADDLLVHCRVTRVDRENPARRISAEVYRPALDGGGGA